MRQPLLALAVAAVPAAFVAGVHDLNIWHEPMLFHLFSGRGGGSFNKEAD